MHVNNSAFHAILTRVGVFVTSYSGAAIGSSGNTVDKSLGLPGSKLCDC